MKLPQRRNYTLNRAFNVNKVVQKNKTAAPFQTEYHNNDIVMRYSPAVFLEAVKVITDDMTKGKKYKNGQIIVEVVKTRDVTDDTGASVEKLVTMEVEVKKKPGLKVKQQMHVYYTTQSLMVQGHRLIAGVKAYKVFVEEFLQPNLKKIMESRKDAIQNTKTNLDNVKLEPKVNRNSKEYFFIACKMCEQKFNTKSEIVEHMSTVHHVEQLALEYKPEMNTCDICKK